MLLVRTLAAVVAVYTKIFYAGCAAIASLALLPLRFDDELQSFVHAAFVVLVLKVRAVAHAPIRFISSGAGELASLGVHTRKLVTRLLGLPSLAPDESIACVPMEHRLSAEQLEYHAAGLSIGVTAPSEANSEATFDSLATEPANSEAIFDSLATEPSTPQLTLSSGSPDLAMAGWAMPGSEAASEAAGAEETGMTAAAWAKISAAVSVAVGSAGSAVAMLIAQLFGMLVTVTMCCGVLAAVASKAAGSVGSAIALLIALPFNVLTSLTMGCGLLVGLCLESVVLEWVDAKVSGPKDYTITTAHALINLRSPQ